MNSIDFTQLGERGTDMSPVLDQGATDGDIVFAVARKAEPAGIIVRST